MCMAETLSTSAIKRNCHSSLGAPWRMDAAINRTCSVEEENLYLVTQETGQPKPLYAGVAQIQHVTRA
eukprot:11216228-Lingulodinium_polyedra.AAC.1